MEQGRTLSVCGLVSWAPGSLAPCSEARWSLLVSHQHLLWEVCADSPAPRHRLFLAAVTVHYSHDNKNSPCLSLSSFPGTPHKGPGLPGPWAPAPHHALPVELGDGQGFEGHGPTARGATGSTRPGPAWAGGLRGRRRGLGPGSFPASAWNGCICLLSESLLC